MSIVKYLLVLHSVVFAFGYGCFYPKAGKHLIANMSHNNGSDGRFPSGTTIVYGCDAGYQMLNNQTRQCLEDGTWSGTQPYCGLDVSTTGTLLTLKSTTGYQLPYLYEDVMHNFLDKCTAVPGGSSTTWSFDLNKPVAVDRLIISILLTDETEQELSQNFASLTLPSNEIIQSDLSSKTVILNNVATDQIRRYTVYQYSINVTNTQQRIYLELRWPREEFHVCGIKFYTSIDIPDTWCSSNRYAIVYNSRCYVFLKAETIWDEALSRCSAINRANLARFGPSNAYILEYIRLQTLLEGYRDQKYWIANTDSFDKDGSLCPMITFNATTNVKFRWTYCTSKNRIICEQDVPKCGTPDRNDGNLVTYDHSYANYSCSQNFKIEGSPERRCRNGQWLTDAPQCKRFACDTRDQSATCSLSEKILIKYVTDTTIEIVAGILIAQWLFTVAVLIYLNFHRD